MTGCKECKSTGTVHVDIPQALNQTLDLQCWFCGGTGLKGMTKEQVLWYRKQSKALASLRKSCLRNGRVEDHKAYNDLKSAINSACVRLEIKMEPIQRRRSSQYGVSDIALYLKAECKELERRLTAIPVAVAQKDKTLVA